MANFGNIGAAFVEVRVNSKKIAGDLRGARRNIGQSAQISGFHAGRAFGTSFAEGIKGIGGTIAAALGTREIVRFADSWTVATNKIAAASQVSGIQAKSLQDLSKAAIGARSDFDAYIEIYSRLLRQGNQVKGNMEEIAIAADVVSKAFKAGGASALEQSSGIIQLGQAIGSGFLQGDELRSIREAAPLLAQAIADEMGVAIGGLKELGAQGKLTSDVIFRALLAGRGKIEAQFAVTQSTIADAFNNLRTGFIRYIGDTNDAIGATRGFVSVMTALGDNLDEVAKGALLIGAVTLGPKIAARTALLGTTLKATAAEIAYQKKVIQGSVVELDSAVATAGAASAKEKAALTALAAARAEEAEAAARVKHLAVVNAQNVKTLESARIRAASASASVAASNEVLIAEKRLVGGKRDLELAERRLQAARKATLPLVAASTKATQAAATATAGLSVASRAGTLAVKGFGLALSFLGGPVGVLLLGLVAVSSGMIDLSDDSEDVAGSLDALDETINSIESNIGKLEKAFNSIESDTKSLERQQEFLTKAIASGSAASEAAARSDLAAIKQRIDANKDLADSVISVLKAERDIAAAQLKEGQQRFVKRFGAAGLDREAAARAALGETGFRELSPEEQLEIQLKAIEEFRAKANAALSDINIKITPDQVEFLKLDEKLKSMALSVEEKTRLLDDAVKGIFGKPKDIDVNVTVSGNLKAAEADTKALIETLKGLEARIKGINDEAQLLESMQFGDVLGPLVDLEKTLRAQGFDDLEIINHVNALSKSLDRLSKAEQKVAQDSLFPEIASEIREMTDEAIAVSAGTGALEDFREEGERSEYLDDYKKRLVAAGVAGTELEERMEALTGAFDHLRDVVATMNFAAAFGELSAEIAAIEGEINATNAAIEQNNPQIKIDYDIAQGIEQKVEAMRKELEKNPITISVPGEETSPEKILEKYREVLMAQAEAEAAASDAFANRSGGKVDTSAADALERRSEAIEQMIESLLKQQQTEKDNTEIINATIDAVGLEENARDALIEQLKLQQMEEQILRDAKAEGIELTEDETKAIKAQIAELKRLVALGGQRKEKLDEQIEAEKLAEETTKQMNNALQATSDELVAAIFEGGNFIEILGKLAIKLLEIQLMQFANSQRAGSGSGGFLGIALQGVLGAIGGAIGGTAANAGVTSGISGPGTSIVPSGSSFNIGGSHPQFSHGGRVEGPGTGTSDGITAQLSDGEFVVNAKATRQHMALLEAINEGRGLPRFADGGMVSGFNLSGERQAPNFGDLGRIFQKDDLEAAMAGASGGGGGRGVNVQMNIQTPDVGSFRRSQTQISAEMGRLIRQGESRQG